MPPDPLGRLRLRRALKMPSAFYLAPPIATARSLRCQEKFETELPGKAPTKEKHREFAKQHLGNTGPKNLNGTPLSEYYHGTAHLGFRSAETLCLRIAKIAAGKMCLFKLVYTDSDCVVPENIHIFPSFWGLNPPRHQKMFLWFYFP